MENIKDPVLDAAITNWIPRLTANGVVLSDFQEITSKLQRWNDWCAVWSSKAYEYERFGQNALAEGLIVSAREHLRRASLYYHFAGFAFVIDGEQSRVAHSKSVECHTLALPLMQPPGCRLEVPFLGGKLFGILRCPIEIQRPPVVILVPGLDSTKEELQGQEDVFLDRGMATFSLDGPGQGESQYDFPLTANYELAISAAIDILSKRSDVNGLCIGLYGSSLGGHYVTRATAFESQRVKATIANGGPFDYAGIWERLPQLTRDILRVRTHSVDEIEALEKLKLFTLEGLAKRIKCPMFILNGTSDRLVPTRDARRFAEQLTGDFSLLLVEGGTHCAVNKPQYWKALTADWMKKKLKSE